MNDFVYITIVPDMLGESFEVLFWSDVDGWVSWSREVSSFSLIEILTGHSPINPPYVVLAVYSNGAENLESEVRQVPTAHLN